MIEHWYLCVDCKTPGCNQRQAVKYVGPADELPDGCDGLDVIVPFGFQAQCEACQEVHGYRLRDVIPRLLPNAPTPAFRNMLPEPDVQH